MDPEHWEIIRLGQEIDRLRTRVAELEAQRDEARHQRDTLATRLNVHLGGQP